MKVQDSSIHGFVVIQQFALDMKSNVYGPFILAGIISLMSIPPILGFTFMVMMTGFVYDFPKGLFPAVSGKHLIGERQLND